VDRRLKKRRESAWFALSGDPTAPLQTKEQLLIRPGTLAIIYNSAMIDEKRIVLKTEGNMTDNFA
jgi:hypothetical protein